MRRAVASAFAMLLGACATAQAGDDDDLERAYRVCAARFWFPGGSRCNAGGWQPIGGCLTVNYPPQWDFPACKIIEYKWKESGGLERSIANKKAKDEEERALIERVAQWR